MAAENIASVVDWYGPFKGKTRQELLDITHAEAKKEFGSGLYLAIGHGPAIRPGPTKLLYIGIGDLLHTRINNDHHKLKELSISEMWLGEVSVPGIPGRRRKKTNPHLDFIEWMSIRFLKIPHNEKKSMSPPDISGVIVNRWWGTDYKSSAEKPSSRWADIIEYDGYRKTGNLVWFGLKGVSSLKGRVKTLII